MSYQIAIVVGIRYGAHPNSCAQRKNSIRTVNVDEACARLILHKQKAPRWIGVRYDRTKVNGVRFFGFGMTQLENVMNRMEGRQRAGASACLRVREEWKQQGREGTERKRAQSAPSARMMNCSCLPQLYLIFRARPPCRLSGPFKLGLSENIGLRHYQGQYPPKNRDYVCQENRLRL
jgi:hypothetical protein